MTPDHHRLSLLLATIAEHSGAPKVAALLKDCGFTGYARDDVLVAVIVELRRRGRDGLASQVASFRFAEAS